MNYEDIPRPTGAVQTDVWLASLTDEELECYIEHHLARFEAARLAPGDGFRAWWLSKIASGAMVERREREQAAALRRESS